jgi:hypothetical protein
LAKNKSSPTANRFALLPNYPSALDGHRNEHAQFLRLGIGIARKGWLTKADVINTLLLEKLKKEFQKKPGK